MNDEKANQRLSLLVLFVVSMVTLGLEILLTRIFSVVLFANHSFLAISLALLGSGAGAIAAYLFKPLYNEELKVREMIVMVLLSLSIAISIFALLQIQFVPLDNNLSYNQRLSMLQEHPELFDFWKLILILPLTFLPFVLAGYVLAINLRAMPAKFGMLYGVDLVGATFGSLTLPFLLYPLGLAGTIAIVVALAVLPAFYVVITDSRQRKWLLAAACMPLIVMGGLGASNQFRLKYNAGWPEKDVIRDYWTPFARVALLNYQGTPMYVIDNGSRSYYAAKTSEYLPTLLSSVFAVPFEMKAGGKSLIIASGGGQEIVLASHFNHRLIDAVEIAGPIITDIVTKMKDEPGNPYLLPNVHYTIADGRSF